MSKKSIEKMRAEWKALELEILIPAKLTDEDFRAVIAARKHPLGYAFRERLPITVARFKPAVKTEIMEKAERRSTPVYSKKYVRLYRADITKINKVLFGTVKIGSQNNGRMGLYQKPRARRLHVDTYKSRQFKAMFVARIGALPVWYVRGKDELNASQKVRNLIVQARLPSDDAEGEKARQELTRRKILVPLRIGNVAMMLCARIGKQVGTLHCSSNVPRGGKRSAFFYSWGSVLRPGA